jgi:hypothetical protein
MVKAGPTVAKKDVVVKPVPVAVGPVVPIKEGMGGSKVAVKGKSLDQIVKDKVCLLKYTNMRLY